MRFDVGIASQYQSVNQSVSQSVIHDTIHHSKHAGNCFTGREKCAQSTSQVSIMDDGVDVSRGFVRNGMREGEAAAASASIMEEE